jgi:IS30 family transposase
MSAEARETLNLGLARGHSLRTMASGLGRAPSPVSRELARNVTRGRPYRACTAHGKFQDRCRVSISSPCDGSPCSRTVLLLSTHST